MAVVMCAYLIRYVSLDAMTVYAIDCRKITPRNPIPKQSNSKTHFEASLLASEINYNVSICSTSSRCDLLSASIGIAAPAKILMVVPSSK